MTEIYLRFVEGGAFDSKIIRWHTCSQWSHVELYSPQLDETFGAMLKGGVIWRSVTDPIYKNASAHHIVPVSLTDDEFALFDKFLTEQKDKPYDWRAIVSFGFGGMTFEPRNWREDDSWFCSELIGRALEVAGVLRFPEGIAAKFLTPRDVWMLVGGLKS